MGVDTEVVLVLPYTLGVRDQKVREGLYVSGFQQVQTEDTPSRSRMHHDIWFRDGRGKRIEELETAVLALPWSRAGVDQHIQVCWWNDFTFQDDRAWGRKAPLSWHHEVWVIPGTQKPSDALAAIERELDYVKTRFKHEERLGCSTISHEVLGFCAACCASKATWSPPSVQAANAELMGWRLLALRAKETHG